MHSGSVFPFAGAGTGMLSYGCWLLGCDPSLREQKWFATPHPFSLHPCGAPLHTISPTAAPDPHEHQIFCCLRPAREYE